MKPTASDSAASELAQTLARRTAPAKLFRVEGGKLRCLACGHRCLIAPGQRGICKVRFNAGSVLRTPRGYVAGLACDPVEKKPFFHVYPGANALTFGMLGCDFHCGYCQNWVTSQALRDPAAVSGTREITAAELVAAGLRHGARLMVSSYNEPLITTEWAAEVFALAQPAGLACAFVSNGNATPEALDLLQPFLTAYKIDLKCFSDARYRRLGGVLENVLAGIRMVHARGIWLEVVTLLIPGFNDSEDELRALTRFVAGVSPDVPWHVTAFHPDYQTTTAAGTTVAQLVRAAEIGCEAGLRFVYIGNVAGRVGQWENTRCPACRITLIARTGYRIHDYRITEEGRCPACGWNIPGVWAANGKAPLSQRAGSPSRPQR